MPTATRPRAGPATTVDASTPTPDFVTCSSSIWRSLEPAANQPSWRRRFPEQPVLWLCHESIYQAVYQPGSPLLRASRLARQRRPRFQPPMLTIHDRPFTPDDRAESGQ
jgi:IS30 family transposase